MFFWRVDREESSVMPLIAAGFTRVCTPFSVMQASVNADKGGGLEVDQGPQLSKDLAGFTSSAGEILGCRDRCIYTVQQMASHACNQSFHWYEYVYPNFFTPKVWISRFKNGHMWLN